MAAQTPIVVQCTRVCAQSHASGSDRSYSARRPIRTSNVTEHFRPSPTHKFRDQSLSVCKRPGGMDSGDNRVTAQLSTVQEVAGPKWPTTFAKQAPSKPNLEQAKYA